MAFSEVLNSGGERQSEAERFVTEAEILSFEGYLKESATYRAQVDCDKKLKLSPTTPLRMQPHQAARIEWTNLRKFRELKGPHCRRSIVFRVLSKETIKAPPQNLWRVTYYCQVIRVE